MSSSIPDLLLPVVKIEQIHSHSFHPNLLHMFLAN
jgi:hypothetical protein